MLVIRLGQFIYNMMDWLNIEVIVDLVSLFYFGCREELLAEAMIRPGYKRENKSQHLIVRFVPPIE